MAGQVHWEILQAIRSLVNISASEAAAGTSEAAFLAVATPRAKVFTPAELGLENLNCKAASNTLSTGNIVDLRGYTTFSMYIKTSYGSASAPTDGSLSSVLAWAYADSGASVRFSTDPEPLGNYTLKLTSNLDEHMNQSGMTESLAIIAWSQLPNQNSTLACDIESEPALLIRAPNFVRFLRVLDVPSLQPGTVTQSFWLAAN